MLRVDGLTRGFSGLLVLHELSFELAPGEGAAVVGPNGSGKTTLLEKLVKADGLRIGHGVQVGYFSQQELELDARGSVLQCVQRTQQHEDQHAGRDDRAPRDPARRVARRPASLAPLPRPDHRTPRCDGAGARVPPTTRP